VEGEGGGERGEVDCDVIAGNLKKSKVVFSPLSTFEPGEPVEIQYGEASSPCWIYLILQYVLRVFLIMLVFILSFSFTNFGNFISGIGGIICCSTGFVLPPLLYTVFHINEMSYLEMTLQISIILFGLISIILSVYFYK